MFVWGEVSTVNARLNIFGRASKLPRFIGKSCISLWSYQVFKSICDAKAKFKNLLTLIPLKAMLIL